eukprot:6172635-Pleurochrysis_carterae.AAC.3
MELTPYHGVSPIFTGPGGVPPGPQHQLKTLVNTMQGCMIQCLQPSYADCAFEQRLSQTMYTDHRTAPVERVAEFAHLVGWEFTLFGGILATSEPPWRWTPAVPVTAVLTPDTYAEGSLRGLRD